MKKFILTCLIGVLSSSSVYAYHCDSDQYQLKVGIRNFGSETCTLKKKYIIQGYIYENDVPSILSDSGENYTFMMGGKEIEAKLSYQCGEYKKFTLYMYQHLKRKYYHVSIDAKMTDAVDVFEKHSTQKTYRNSCQPGQISWQISH